MFIMITRYIYLYICIHYVTIINIHMMIIISIIHIYIYIYIYVWPDGCGGARLHGAADALNNSVWSVPLINAPKGNGIGAKGS